MISNVQLERIEDFKLRKLKARQVFTVKSIPKNVAYDFVKTYHYLGNAKFFAKFSYGLYMDDELVGVASFACPQGTTALKGWFGLPNDDQSVLELSRLCMLPILNGTNATSFLLGGGIRQLKHEGIRAVITLADASRHIGSIYQVCNFKYYGLSDYKCDFYRYPDGLKNPRGTTSKWHGVWLPRTRKHRYAYIMDDTLQCLYDEQTPPQTKGEVIITECCEGLGVVHDNRYDEYYTCPKCEKQFQLIGVKENVV